MWSPPFAEVSVDGKTALGDECRDSTLVAELCGRVVTHADTDESVVEGLVGLIGATDNLSVLVTVRILLSESVNGEKEACRSKNSEEQFDTFHSFYQKLIVFLAKTTQNYSFFRRKQIICAIFCFQSTI